MADKRIDMVDALRGFALLGLFMVHCVERFELYWLDPQPDDAALPRRPRGHPGEHLSNDG